MLMLTRNNLQSRSFQNTKLSSRGFSALVIISLKPKLITSDWTIATRTYRSQTVDPSNGQASPGNQVDSSGSPGLP